MARKPKRNKLIFNTILFLGVFGCLLAFISRKRQEIREKIGYPPTTITPG
jgi:hypothetical protein